VALAIGAGILGVIGILFGIIALFSANKAKRRIRRRNPAELNDPTAQYEEFRQDLQEIQTQINQLQGDVESTQAALRQKIGTPQIMRYNAFHETGNDLSFSVALVDEAQSGVVLSSIYGREESRVYAKPVEQGESKYPLTDEELMVLTGIPSQEDSPRRRRPVHN
jgi:uncharacterized protein YlxW (UPF0749 family)